MAGSPHRPIVLLAEDNADERDMYAQYLTTAGFQVVAVVDGAAAVVAVATERPLIIVMDMAMPNMSGAEATRRIKQDPALSNIPIIALTAYPYETHRAVSAEVGADAFVQKPCAPSALLDLILNMLNMLK